MTIVPGLICVGGVFFFHLGLAGSLIMYKLSLAASVSNAMLPLIQAKKPPLLEAQID